MQGAAMAGGLSEECQRLRNHIADLETRKRAPLYQKKQEEELKVPPPPMGPLLLVPSRAWCACCAACE